MPQTVPLILSFMSSVFVIKKAHIHLSHNAKGCLCAFGRKEATRTPDPYVPNVVRYQLRYFPIKALQN